MIRQKLPGESLRAIVIDDEKLSREVLCNYLKEYCPEVEVSATASSIKSAYKAIKKYLPHLIFLDIEMSDGKGFDLLSMFDKIDFKIIFITAYSDYAVKAFRFSAVDYLLKPVKIDELKEAVSRVWHPEVPEPDKGNLSVLMSNLKGGRSQIPTLVIPHLKGFLVLKIPEIIMCQADGYCTNFHLTGNRKIISSKNLKHFYDLLSDHNFIRIHHSFIINLDHVTGYNRQGEILLTENLTAFLGDSYKNDFIKRFSRK
jgi:two-component system LytT family response regulator